MVSNDFWKKKNNDYFYVKLKSNRLNQIVLNKSLIIN